MVKALSASEGTTRRSIMGLSALIGSCLLAAPLAALPQAAATIDVAKFSIARPGGPLPNGWEPWILSKRKNLTNYSLVDDGGTVVVKAVSRDSASGLIRRIRIDPKQYPIIQWRWKAASLIATADNSKRTKEDSPVRIYIGFEGDVSKLDLHDRLFFKVIKLASGQELPYATLNYIWENSDPRGTVMSNPNTDRIKMIVVESGPARLNRWVGYERNVVEDYQRAFGTEPPMIVGVFLMTDTDNTGESATGYYGDIVFRQAGTPKQP
jgi:hypothetical protein